MLYCPVCETYWLRNDWKLDAFEIVTSMGYVVEEICDDCAAEPVETNYALFGIWRHTFT